MTLDKLIELLNTYKDPYEIEVKIGYDGCMRVELETIEFNNIKKEIVLWAEG